MFDLQKQISRILRIEPLQVLHIAETWLLVLKWQNEPAAVKKNKSADDCKIGLGELNLEMGDRPAS